MEVKQVHNVLDGEENSYDSIIVDGKDIGSLEQVTFADILTELGFKYDVNNDDDIIEIITYRLGAYEEEV